MHLENASNLGKITRFSPEHSFHAPDGEPTNAELGIVPITGWRLIAVWAVGAAMGIGAWSAVAAWLL